jgi:hypothetical protein
MGLFQQFLNPQGRWERRLYCAWCTRLFLAPGSRARLYCSRPCRSAAYRARLLRPTVEANAIDETQSCPD